jgi:hypothetical protein
MFTGDNLVIKGPYYHVLQPNGEPFLLGRLLKRGQIFYIQTGEFSDIFEFENMPSPSEFPIGINNCRYTPVFSISTDKGIPVCWLWDLITLYCFDNADINLSAKLAIDKHKGPIYIQR